MQVKVCGITTLADARLALTAGADFLGFNFHPPSPRSLTPQACAQLVADLQADLRALPRPVTLVGVFVHSTAAEIQAILSLCHLHLAQLSGPESPELAAAFGENALVALRPASAAGLQASLNAFSLRTAAPRCLVDAFRAGEFGGTGQLADWSLASQVAAQLSIFLAGGLTPENVAQAIQQVHPWGVDVASGVESAPGRKDFTKMKQFIANAHAALEE